ncbi:MAG: helix-turn-helix transcriptional regulator [Lachnospiraceae bacterium]|nr:helix-turn-helix transcriptional regulator [Lachnospiraceae bacterium]
MICYNLEECGKRIKELRKKKGYTQAVLSERVGISLDSMKRIERGAKGGSIDTLLVLMVELDSSMDYLLVGREPVSRLDCLMEGFNEAERRMVECTAETIRQMKKGA